MRIKGAAARKAAAEAARAKLLAAREAAVMAKCRVLLVHGELYYPGSRALEEADAVNSIYAVPKADAQGTCAALDVTWLDPGISKAAVQETFESFGAVKFVQLHDGHGRRGVPMTTGRSPLAYNYATVTFHDKSDAAAARRALNGASLLRSAALAVCFASGRAAVDNGEFEPEFDETDLDPPDDPESDEMDHEDFDDMCDDF